MKPTIVIPGIKGSTLENFYPLNVQTTWAEPDVITGPSLKSVILDPNGVTDLAEDVVNRAGRIFPIAYGSLVEGLRSRLKVPVYVFPYDWRVSNAESAKRLVQFVTLLQKKKIPSAKKWDGKFHFVCHSMGGLVLRRFLKDWKDTYGVDAPLDRCVFVGTPHLGSLDAVEALIRGETALFEGKKEMRKVARSFPAVYELLPRFDDAIVDHANGHPDIFNANNWQSNIVGAPRFPEKVAQRRLDEAKAFLESLPPLQKTLKGKALNVYGSRPESTLQTVKVNVRTRNPKNWYDFENADKGDGDGVVPVDSAAPLGLAKVCIPFSAVSWWAEPAARFFDFHAFLPTLDEVQTVVARFLAGSKDLKPLGLKRAR
jgi:pimeloyl-ACP methyl ester carboxylesterase